MLQKKPANLVGMLDVNESEDLMITCKSGVTIRMKVADISEQGRATQGVKLIRLDDGDEIAAITKLDDQVQQENGTNGIHTNGDTDATNTDENPSLDDTAEK